LDNVKTAWRTGGTPFLRGMLVDVGGKLALEDRKQESINFCAGSGYTELDATVIEVTHTACDFEAGCNFTDRPAKSNALNSALVVNFS
jgi:hypothetical protein